MTRVVSLQRPRWSRVWAVGAAVLIVLIVLPFTAPFASVDLTDLLGGRPLGESTYSASEAKDVSDDLVVAVLFDPRLGSETSLDATSSHVTRFSALRTIVLRI